MAEGIVSLSIRAWDGDEWLSGWDSDRQGLPMGVEILITATGAKPGEDPWDAPLVDLRTVVPIDRVTPPKDHFEEIEVLLAEELAEEQGGTGTVMAQRVRAVKAASSQVASNPAAVDDQA